MANERSSLDVLGAVASLAATALAFTAFLFPKSRIPAILLLLAALLAFAVWFTKRFRSTRVIHGYKETLNLVEQLIAGAETSVWTVRTHIGEASAEELLFKVLANRVQDHKRPLEDVRRNIRLANSPATRTHLVSLIQTLGAERVVKVKYFVGVGPKYDFIIIDGKVAVIGLPRSEGDLVGASILVRDPIAVRCIESAFEDLWNSSKLLFKGDTQNNADRIQELVAQLSVVISTHAEPPLLPPSEEA